MVSRPAPDNHDRPAAAPDASQLLTYSVAEGARILRKSERWYRRQLAARFLPGHRAGRTWFLTESDIATALDVTRVPSTAARRTPPQQPTRPARRRNRRRARPIPPQSAST